MSTTVMTDRMMMTVTEAWLPGLQGKGRVDSERCGGRGDGPPGAVGSPGEHQGQQG